MPESFFRVTRSESANVVALTLPEALDSKEFDRINEEMLAIFGTRPRERWVLDLSGLSYMGSSALGLMVNIRQRVKGAGGELVLCGLSPRLLRIFQTCCMERLFRITRNQADALKYVRA